MLHRARARRRRLIRPALASLLCLLGAPVHASEESGDVFLSVENSDSRASRFGYEAVWLQPVASWLDLEAGGRYAEFDRASWGYGIAGAHLTLPFALGFASLRYEAGAGRAETDGSYTHQIGDLSWSRALWARWAFVEAGAKLIRVGRVRDDLGRIGLAVAPADWLLVRGGYLHSVFNGRGTDGWSIASQLALRDTTLVAGFARTRDSLDLRSLGRGRVRGAPANQYSLAVTLPFAPHGLTLAATRYEGSGDTRHTLGLTWRWSLPAWPFDAPAGASDEVAGR